MVRIIYIMLNRNCSINHAVAGIALLLCSTSLWAGEILGYVNKVYDGDTVLLQTSKTDKQIKIRIAAIDAPEYQQPGGQQSKAALSSLVLHRTIQADCYKKDRYHRHVCILKDRHTGADFGLKMVKLGHAWHYKYYAEEQTIARRLAYASAEFSAKKKQLGLWSKNKPTAPWDWRKSNKQPRQSPTQWDRLRFWLNDPHK